MFEGQEMISQFNGLQPVTRICYYRYRDYKIGIQLPRVRRI